MPTDPFLPPVAAPACEAAASAPGRLPLDTVRGVRLVIEGSDIAAVEAAAAELKLRFGSRFAVTGRRLAPGRQTLRISAGLLATPDAVLDAEGIRQWSLPAP